MVEGAGTLDELWAVPINNGVPGVPIRVSAALAPGEQISRERGSPTYRDARWLFHDRACTTARRKARRRSLESAIPLLSGFSSAFAAFEAALASASDGS
jgi:hypothetical protein